MNERKQVRGHGRVFLRGNIWWCQFYDHGRQRRESTGETEERKALKFLDKCRGEVQAGIVRDKRKLRYEDLRDSYLESCEMSELKSLRRTADGKVYLESVRRMDDFFAGCRAVEITPDLMRKFQREMKAKGYSNGSVNRSLASLRKMFSLAARDGKLHHLPFFPMLKEAKPRKGTLSREGYEELVKALPAYLKLPVVIAFSTGMRLGEIKKLTWKENIKWLDKIIRLEDSKERHGARDSLLR
jgi:integrase